MQPLIDQARAILRETNRLVVLTGAGISAESGVPTYRGAGGIWEGFSAAELASPEGFAADPQKVWTWHDQRRQALAEIRPNPAHEALVRLEQRLRRRGAGMTLATQNIEGLHQRAGSPNVLELHGTILAIRCCLCPHRRYVGLEPVGDDVPVCPRCGNFMRPAVVWFGEQLPQDVWQAAAEAAGRCDAFMSIGTSAVVYPAAALIQLATHAGARTIEVNLEPTPASRSMHVAIHGKAGEILPRLVE